MGPAWRWLVVACAALLAAAPGAAAFRPELLSDGRTPRPTRIVRTQQGHLEGLVYEPSGGSGGVGGPSLRRVDVFRGLPYAAPLDRHTRFMPPQSPHPWPNTVLRAVADPPPCPQPPPPPAALRRPAVRRLLQRMPPPAEDCLKLNVFVPHQERTPSAPEFPVLVLVLAESLEWSAGAAYDGCALASYGNVLVITFNFRLGVLGFLSPPDSREAHGNYGLWDAIAVLQWVRDNARAFGGDPGNVTLLGHGPGAALAALLLLSPAAGAPPPAPADDDNANAGAAAAHHTLFHRAALLSGSALADWAVVRAPEQAATAATQLAQDVNCALRPRELLTCLRKRRLDELVNATVHVPAFAPRWAPVVDGRAVANLPDALMHTYHDMFSRYPLLLGLTEIESLDFLPDELHPLVKPRSRMRNPYDAMMGVLQDYMLYRFPLHQGAALGFTLETYVPNSILRSLAADEARDALLDILTDARVAAPVLRTADLLAATPSRPRCFLYVFAHSSRYGDYNETTLNRAVSGEELPYVLGLPLDRASPSVPHDFTDEEVLLAKAVVTYIANFAKTGNPNLPHRTSFLEQAVQFSGAVAGTDVRWPEYDPRNQSYLRIELPFKSGRHYRQQVIKFWTSVLPETLDSNPRPRPPYVPPPLTPHPAYEPPVAPLPPAPAPEPPRPRPPPPPPAQQPPPSNDFPPPLPGPPPADPPPDGPRAPLNLTDSGSVALIIVIAVGVTFLLVNLCAFAGIYVQRDRLRAQEEAVRRRYEDLALMSPVERCPLYEARATLPGPALAGAAPPPMAPGMSVSLPGHASGGMAVGVATMAGASRRPDDDYEAIRSGAGPMATAAVHRPAAPPSAASASASRWGGGGGPLSRQCSASTMDAHSKVREWIVARCSPRCMRRNQPPVVPDHAQGPGHAVPSHHHHPHPQAAATGAGPGSHHAPHALAHGSGGGVPAPATGIGRPPQPAASVDTSIDRLSECHAPLHRPCAVARPRKVSVAVDATPAARDASVQRQLSCDAVSSTCASSPAIAVTRSLDELGPAASACCVSTSSITLRRPAGASTSDGGGSASGSLPPPQHAHTRSDPAPMSTFAPQPLALRPAVNVNVTSRDSGDEATDPGSPRPLDSMQRRNFPKVLPDLPGGDSSCCSTPTSAKRRSLPEPALAAAAAASAAGAGAGAPGGGKVPPPPPPRVCSTLGRQPSSPTGAHPRVVIKAPPLTAAPAVGTLRRPTARAAPAPGPAPAAASTEALSGGEDDSSPTGSSSATTSSSDGAGSGTGTVRRAAGWYGRYSRAVRSNSRDEPSPP